MQPQTTLSDIYSFIIEHGLTSSIASSLSLTDCDGINSSAKIDFGNGTTWFYKESLTNFRTGDPSVGVDREGWFYERVWRGDCIKGLCTIIPELIHYNKENHFLILRYLEEWETLRQYYLRTGRYPTSIACCIAELLASVHEDSSAHPDKYNDFYIVAERRPVQILKTMLTPEEAAELPPAALEAVGLVQRHSKMVTALDELRAKWQPMCLIHKDVKSNNFLKPIGRIRQKQVPLILLDWESWDWGDPAWDLGAALGDYLWIWLCFLNIVKEQPIKEWFATARTPFERVRPAMHALWSRYAELCKTIFRQRREMPQLVIQNIGLFLLSRVMAESREGGDLTVRGLCTLQVSKNLLEYPEKHACLLLGEGYL